MLQRASNLTWTEAMLIGLGLGLFISVIYNLVRP